MATTETQADHLIQEWAAGWATRDLERVAAVFTDDCIYEDVPMGVVNHGKDEFRDFGNAFLAAVPDFEVKLTSHLAAGGWGAAEWEMSGTHSGDLPNMPASGRTFSIRGASVFEVAGERLRRCSDYWDAASWLRQLGFMPEG
jgi:steroid delta-isomerase-like uncharacterized protein